MTSSAGRSGEDCGARFELADFELDFVFLAEADVRWIGDDEIVRAVIEAVQQIGVVKVDAALGRVVVGGAKFQLQARGVGFGDFERGGRVVGGVDFGGGEFLGQG